MALEPGGIAALLVAPVLLTAGAAKLAVPAGARDSFGSLAAWTSRISTSLTVRLAAGTELAAGLLLTIPTTRSIGALAALAFGICFAALGIWGKLAAVQVGCGCFGAASAKPLGPRNVAIGVAVALLSLIAFTGSPDTTARATAGNLDVAALLSLLLTFALFRELLPRQLLPITGMERRR